MKPRIEMPDFPNPDIVTGGRNMLEGYQRGWSLQFGDMVKTVEADPLYQAARKAGEWSMIMPHKVHNLFILLTCFLQRLPSQNIIEFGSYRGGNALFMGYILKHLYPGAKVYALDTYAGMPATDPHRDLHQAGDFLEASKEALEQRARDLKLDNIVAVKGLFADTFPGLKGIDFGMAHIDCDIYPGVKYAQEAVWPQMVKGGYVVYDDADVSSCIGATEAVEDMMMEKRIHTEQVWPHWILRAF